MAVQQRPASITLGQLQATVGGAVRAAAAKHKFAIENEIAIGPGTLVGPYLRMTEGASLAAAQAVASEITAVAQKAMEGRTGATGAALPVLQAGFTVSHHLLICGFWPGPWPVLDATRPE